MSKLLPVIEIFGPTIQGEGALIGVPTAFVRFGGCDYRCSWCDTLYAVLPEQVKENAQRMTAEEVVKAVLRLAPHVAWVTLSGGNPAIHNLEELVMRLKWAGYHVAVETQGSVQADWLTFCDMVTVSPKPPSSGMETDFDTLDRVVDSLCASGIAVVLKVVAFDADDFYFARDIQERYPNVALAVQPGCDIAGDTVSDLLAKLRWLTEMVTSEPKMGEVAVLPQLHVLMWGQERGV